MAQWLSLHVPLWQPGVCGFGSLIWTYSLFIKPCCGGIPHIKQRKTSIGVSSGQIFLKQKEKDWQQMLPRGQSSSPKKKKRKNFKQRDLSLSNSFENPFPWVDCPFYMIYRWSGHSMSLSASLATSARIVLLFLCQPVSITFFKNQGKVLPKQEFSLPNLTLTYLYLHSSSAPRDLACWSSSGCLLMLSSELEGQFFEDQDWLFCFLLYCAAHYQALRKHMLKMVWNLKDDVCYFYKFQK